MFRTITILCALIALAFFSYADRSFPPMEDCNQNGVEDALDIAYGSSNDTNGNGLPDECEKQSPLARTESP